MATEMKLATAKMVADTCEIFQRAGFRRMTDDEMFLTFGHASNGRSIGYRSSGDPTRWLIDITDEGMLLIDAYVVHGLLVEDAKDIGGFILDHLNENSRHNLLDGVTGKFADSEQEFIDPPDDSCVGFDPGMKPIDPVTARKLYNTF